MESTKRRIFKSVWCQIQAFSVRKNKPSELNIVFNLVDIIMFVTFLITTTILSLSTREKTLYLYANAIEKHFIDRPVYNEFGFEMTYKDLITVSDWWSFMETTFIESIAQFDGSNSDNNDSHGALENNVLLGNPRMRQIRIANATCSIHNAFRNQFRTCYGEYSKANEDINGFFNTTEPTTSEKHMNFHPNWGKISFYDGVGYIETLSSTSEENEAILKKLKSLNWIDRGTRMVVIEFVTFNANVNLLCNIKILVEFSTSGGIVTSSSIHSLRYSVVCEDSLECFCAVLFLIIQSIYTLDLLLKMKLIGVFNTMKSIWRIMDFIVISIVYLLIIYTAWHTKYLKRIFETEEDTPPDVFSLDVICFWNTIFNTGVGICVFLMWIKTFEYIQFHKTMLQFSSTIKKCERSLFGFMVMFAIILIAYANLSVLLFGTTHSDFRDFPTALITMIRMVLGDLSYSEMEESSPILGPMYFLSYILFVFFILLNMFLAIINDTFSEVKSKTPANENDEIKKTLVMVLEKIPLISKSKKKTTSSHEQPIRSKIEDGSGVKKHSNRKENVIHSFFEEIPTQKNVLQMNELNKSIEILEKTVDNLVKLKFN